MWKPSAGGHIWNKLTESSKLSLFSSVLQISQSENTSVSRTHQMDICFILCLFTLFPHDEETAWYYIYYSSSFHGRDQYRSAAIILNLPRKASPGQLGIMLRMYLENNKQTSFLGWWGWGGAFFKLDLCL